MSCSKTASSIRFREARERMKLSPEEAARRLCVSSSSLFQIESDDDELASVHSAGDIQRFCQVLGIRPCDLFGIQSAAKPVSFVELAGAITEHCQTRGVAIAEFEETTGWCVARSLQKPQRFLDDYSLTAIHDICRELGMEWERFILGL